MEEGVIWTWWGLSQCIEVSKWSSRTIPCRLLSGFILEYIWTCFLTLFKCLDLSSYFQGNHSLPDNILSHFIRPNIAILYHEHILREIYQNAEVNCKCLLKKKYVTHKHTRIHKTRHFLWKQLFCFSFLKLYESLPCVVSGWWLCPAGFVSPGSEQITIKMTQKKKGGKEWKLVQVNITLLSSASPCETPLHNMAT